MSTLVEYFSSFLGGGSRLFLLCVLPVVIIVFILWICKKYNFSILPQDLQGKRPIPFKLPKLSRKEQGRMYKWTAEDRSDPYDPSNRYDMDGDYYEDYEGDESESSSDEE